MDEQELKQLNEMINKSIGNAFEQIMIPALHEVKQEISEIKIDVSELKEDVSVLKVDVSNLKREVGVIRTRYPDKAYLDDKINDLRGDILTWRKQDSARMDRHIEIHHRKGNLTDEEVEELGEIRGFAPLPA